MRALRNKKNNKGFSLVELIIVIAIMAILVGTLAPQYLRYVEKSRLAADAQTIEEITSVLQVIAASPDNELLDKDVIRAKYDGTSGAMVFQYKTGTDDTDASFTAITSTTADTVKQAKLLKEFVDVSRSYKLKSSTYKTAGITITLKYEDNIWKVTNSHPTLSAE